MRPVVAAVAILLAAPLAGCASSQSARTFVSPDGSLTLTIVSPEIIKSGERTAEMVFELKNTSSTEVFLTSVEAEVTAAEGELVSFELISHGVDSDPIAEAEIKGINGTKHLPIPVYFGILPGLFQTITFSGAIDWEVISLGYRVSKLEYFTVDEDGEARDVVWSPPPDGGWSIFE